MFEVDVKNVTVTEKGREGEDQLGFGALIWTINCTF